MDRRQDSFSSNSLMNSGRPSSQPIQVDTDSEDSDDTLLGDDKFEAQIMIQTPEPNANRTYITSTDEHLQFRELLSYSSDGRTFKIGKTVELQDGDLLRVALVLQHRHTEAVYLRGIRFRRNLHLEGVLELKMNEVAMILRCNETDPRGIFQQSMDTVSVQEVINIRELIRTNRLFPALSFRESDPQSVQLSREEVYNQCRLSCRWKLLIVTKNEGFLQALNASECDDGCDIPSEVLRHAFRGDTVKGGASPNWTPAERQFDSRERARCRGVDPMGFHRLSDAALLQEAALRTRTQHLKCVEQRYTCGDAFCGAGGASRAAKAAGFQLCWACDHNQPAMHSYQKNFHGAECLVTSVHDFVKVWSEDFKVDHLHMSPPCQPFSPDHTRPGKDDDLNSAAFLSTEELIRKVRPRTVTLEETLGLTRTVEHLVWFTAMIQMFTKLGFSVRWNVFNLSAFGLPQPRKRLIVFASCPGEPLPEFPKPTHCKQSELHHFPGLSRLNAVNDAIKAIPRGFPLHNPQFIARKNAPPYDGDQLLRNTITCAGAHSYHPSGTRAFTTRELAALNGFPLEHEFGPVGVTKQIGNAVPPVAMLPFMIQIIRSLMRTDGLIRD